MPTPDPETIKQIRRAFRRGDTVRQIKQSFRIGREVLFRLVTAEDRDHRLAKGALPAPKTDPRPKKPRAARGPRREPPALPEPWQEFRESYTIDAPGWWGVLGDLHVPMHDRATVEAFVAEAKRRRCVGVLLNGDFIDALGVSPFFRTPSERHFKDEITAARQALAYLRTNLPKARLVYREGNHEFRLTRFLVERACELWGIEEFTLPSLLRLDKFGVEWVADKRMVMLGKLITLHGHELRKGEGVNPARLAFLRTTSTVLVSHHHRTSEHHQRSLDGRHLAAWSVGCACHLLPDFDPYNQWNLGFAFVKVENDGWFHVENRRVLQGRVV